MLVQKAIALMACVGSGDLYESIKYSFELVYPKLVKGAVVFIHDYGAEIYPGTGALLDCHCAA